MRLIASSLSKLILLSAALMCTCSSIYVLSQPLLSAQIVSGTSILGTAGYAFEYTFVGFDSTSLIRSLRSSIALTLPRFNAWYVPVDVRLIAFRGSHHAEIAATANIQVVHSERGPEDLDDFWASSQAVVPSVSVSYRFEPEEGGFVLRLGWALAYYVVDRHVRSGPVIGVGYSW